MDLATTPARRPMEAGLARRLWHVVLAVCHMLRRGLCRKRVMMDLHLLLGRGKLAGRALRGLLAQPATAHGHDHRISSSSTSATASFYGHHARAVEFSCTTTPSYPQYYGLFPFKSRGGRSGGGRGTSRDDYGGLDAAAVARAFEMMSADVESGRATPAVAGMATATPSPMVAWILGRSPAGVRRLRVTDSPFPVVPEDGNSGSNERVDAEADDFIKRFYEQLRMQHSVAIPEC
ncbi:uncharacterized protein LOC123408262 [Hordeum vulgare subsp. vulgare]|uniref:Avr9/Cf-9 rapidly elicited protein 146 n=1 Tax=Hordeum vulgare subsp. vulgare TaxID=112509 RepID=A0A8I6X3R2_HORVV|nr:uncharacterized protein LOC123408262 [Hordeum vulgare subsp. vulgare]KAI4962789.1 hypothetical protein ZWY2020_025343 [Hordeum vulgare]KAI5021593.1 hypothetical protein ZWY2020_058323 [Hordeum vulgare]